MVSHCHQEEDQPLQCLLKPKFLRIWTLHSYLSLFWQHSPLLCTSLSLWYAPHSFLPWPLDVLFPLVESSFHLPCPSELLCILQILAEPHFLSEAPPDPFSPPLLTPSLPYSAYSCD